MMWFGIFLGILLTIGGTYAVANKGSEGLPALLIGITWLVLMVINNIIYEKKQAKRIDTL